jgi:hypothetical protein
MMSLIVALLGKNCGVVASDSIKVSPQGDVSFDFDKTFSLQRPLMIGAHVGLLEFAGAKIADHVYGIAAESKLGSIREVADRIALELIKKLNLSEIAFENRKVELLTLSRKKFRSGRYEIRPIDLSPNSNTGVIDYIPGLYHSAGALAHSGDDQARVHVKEFLDRIRDKIPAMKMAQLKQISLDAITYGIERCGKHPRFPDVPACGGPPCAIAI